VNELALFAGAGGGILGGHLLGWRTVCAVEWEAYPASVLCARQNDKILPTFPIWDDVQTFDGKPWRGIVEVVSGGFPCQDISVAGGGMVLMEKDQDYGKRWQGLLAKLDLDTALWKIPQCSLLEDLEQSLEIWPNWGSMRNGVCWEQMKLVQTIKENEFGLWLTPTATAISGRSPKAMEYRTKQRESQGHNTVQPGNLAEQVMYSGKMPCKDMKNPTWPTPVARMWKDNASPSEFKRHEIPLAAQVGGKLNPEWTEWLMGWMLGWTDLKPLATDKSHFVQQQHLTC
jgi:DNA (cytosine-5)-methyltransferase 1